MSSPSARAARRRAHRQAELVHHPELAERRPQQRICHWDEPAAISSSSVLHVRTRAGEVLEFRTDRAKQVTMLEFKRVFVALDAAHGWEHSGAAVLALWCEHVSPFTTKLGSVFELSSASDTVSESALNGLLSKLYKVEAKEEEERAVRTPSYISPKPRRPDLTYVERVGMLTEIARDACVGHEMTPHVKFAKPSLEEVTVPRPQRLVESPESTSSLQSLTSTPPSTGGASTGQGSTEGSGAKKKGQKGAFGRAAKARGRTPPSSGHATSYSRVGPAS